MAEYIAIWTIVDLDDSSYSRVSDLVKRVLVNVMGFQLLTYQNTTAVRGPEPGIAGATHLMAIFWDEVEGGGQVLQLAEDILVQAGRLKPRMRGLVENRAKAAVRANLVNKCREELYTAALVHLKIDFIISQDRATHATP